MREICTSEEPKLLSHCARIGIGVIGFSSFDESSLACPLDLGTGMTWSKMPIETPFQKREREQDSDKIIRNQYYISNAISACYRCVSMKKNKIPQKLETIVPKDIGVIRYRSSKEEFPARSVALHCLPSDERVHFYLLVMTSGPNVANNTLQLCTMHL
jgi:hypothetical protein